MVLDAGVDTVEHGTAATAEQVARMAAEGVALVPTLLPLAALQRTAEPIPQDIQERAAEVRAVQSATVAAAIEAGVTVLPGTDAGTPFNPVGNLVAEMELLAELGLGNAGVIAAATSQAATVVGLEGRGVIAPGAPADLVLVAGDPTEDLSVLRCPSVIVQDGIVHR